MHASDSHGGGSDDKRQTQEQMNALTRAMLRRRVGPLKSSEPRAEKPTVSRIRLDAEARSDTFGGGRLRDPWPSRIRHYCSREDWEEFKSTVNQELKAEMQLRRLVHGQEGIPTLITCFCFAIALLVAVIVSVLDLYEEGGVATLIVPWCFILAVWAFLQAMFWKYSAKLDRRMAALRARLKEACEKFSEAHRALFVSMYMGQEVSDAMDPKKQFRYMKTTRDVFYLDVIVIPNFARPAAEEAESSEPGSTRTPSARSSESFSLRNAAKADDQLEPETESVEVRPPSNGSTEKKTPPGARCPEGHLLEVADGHDWNCDACDRGLKIGEFIYMCEQCDFGLCKTCMRGHARAPQKNQEGELLGLDLARPGSHGSGSKSLASAGSRLAWT